MTKILSCSFSRYSLLPVDTWGNDTILICPLIDDSATPVIVVQSYLALIDPHCVSVLSAVADINLAIEKCNAQETFKQMLRAECCISNLDEECREKYQEALAQHRAHKLKAGVIFCHCECCKDT